MDGFEIMERVPFGRENAIPRQELARMVGMRERIVRLKLKHVLKSTGEPILSSSNQAGYWRSEEPDEWAACILEFRRRARSTEDTIQKLSERYYDATGIWL